MARHTGDRTENRDSGKPKTHLEKKKKKDSLESHGEVLTARPLYGQLRSRTSH